MATTAPPARTSAPFAKGSIIWEKKGPLPVWAWAGLLLGLVLIVVMWRRNKTQAEANTAATGGADYGILPGTQGAPAIFVVPQVGGTTIPSDHQPRTPSPRDMPRRRRHPGPVPPDTTTPPAPPGGGRQDPPGTPPPPSLPQIPASLTAPANTNLYNWSQQVESQYTGFSGTIFDIIRGQGSLKWMPAGWGGADPSYGNVPVFPSATTVRFR